MEQYNVTGMSCAACSSRVEKAVSRVPGVTSCSVSLLTNSMGVDGNASSHDIIQAVEQAGYGFTYTGMVISCDRPACELCNQRTFDESLGIEHQIVLFLAQASNERR